MQEDSSSCIMFHSLYLILHFAYAKFFHSIKKQAKAEQEEEYISNTLMKKIQALKKEKEILATNYEQEEEYLTNDLSKKLSQVRISTMIFPLHYNKAFLQ